MQEMKTYDAKVAAQRRASVALAVGWTLLAFAMIAGIYIFQDIREGSRFFIVLLGSAGVARIDDNWLRQTFKGFERLSSAVRCLFHESAPPS